MKTSSPDRRTAEGFASSWNNLPQGSVYTWEQFRDWLSPLEEKHISGKEVLELGCGNASLMCHLLHWMPRKIHGIDLGDSVIAARKNLAQTEFDSWSIEKADLISYQSSGYDVVFCIGVLHHLHHPQAGFQAVIRNLRPGGRFHCWVYAKEGNAIIIWIVDPIRRLVSRFPWWITKFVVAGPLSVIFFFYVKGIFRAMPKILVKWMPLYEYCRWISVREFRFFHHVVFDQLVARSTVYIDRAEIESWLGSIKGIDSKSTYINMRNGNSWKFGGVVG